LKTGLDAWLTARRTLSAAMLVLVCTNGCATIGLSRGVADDEAIVNAKTEIPDDRLLNVSIELFDPGRLSDKELAAGLSMDIRKAESRFIPAYLRLSMEKTGQWAAVRVVPSDSEGSEALVGGRIIRSDGGILELRVTASDSTGRRWFKRNYSYRLPDAQVQLALARNSEGQSAADAPEPFQPLYNKIANDLVRYRRGLKDGDMLAIRRTAEMRFAADLAPDAFAGDLKHERNGRYELVGLPAREDPMYRRVQAIRTRDAMLIDVLSDQADNFYREMREPYAQWRKARLAEAAALRVIETKANKRKLLGLVAIAGAIAVQILGGRDAHGAGNVVLAGGVYAMKTGFDIAQQAEIHRAAIAELDQSFAAESRPLVVEVEGRTHELTGSAEVQYAQWRELLRETYSSETGLLEAHDGESAVGTEAR